MVHNRINQAITQHDLSESFHDIVQQWYRPLAHNIALASSKQQDCFFLGVQGCQGSGKSTMAAFLKIILEDEYQLRVCVLSLDDFYLTLKARRELAKRIHPLLVTRGVPGTHDLPLAKKIFNELSLLGKGETLALPVFNKAVDDRVLSSFWPNTEGPVDVVIFEGWCVGIEAQDEGSLVSPVNRLEAEEDSHRIWRNYVNQQLKEDYARLFSRLNKLIVLAAPSFECVYQWRALQEKKLADRVKRENLTNTKLLDTDGLLRFISHYERLTLHCLKTLPEKADWLLPLNEHHQIVDLIENHATRN